MKKSIKIKLTVFVTTIILLIISIQVLFNQFYAMPFFMQDKTRLIEELYTKIENSLNSQSSNIKSIIMPYEEREHLRVAIWNHKNEMIYSSDIEEFIHYQDASLIFRENPSVEYHASYRTGEDSLMVLGKVAAPDDSYNIVIETPTSAVHHTVELILKLNLIIAFIVLTIGSICAWWFGKKYTSPILEIDRVAQAVANLDFSQKVSISNREDEIGKLGENINLMSEQLADLISKLQKANEQLEKDVDYQKRIDNMRREFIANVSHELKSPLALLTMSSENLKGDLPHIDKNFYCDVIMEESLRLGELVKRLLEISALEHGMTQMNYEHFNFSKYVKRIYSKNKVFLNDKGIRLKINIEHNLSVYGDKFYLEQAITNYLDNAKNHTSANKEIEIGLKRENNRVRFYVFNEGKPISKNHMEQIWDSFYKADPARTHTDDIHSGLGLYIVRTIITNHSGKYGVTNRENGVEFWFELPLDVNQ